MLVADFEVARRAFPVRLSFELEPGERIALLGRSGAGKTTTLEALAGLLHLTRGEIWLGQCRLSAAALPAADVPAGRRGVGLLRQNPGLFPHLTVIENIRYSGGVTLATAAAAGSRLGLGALLGARPKSLSGGEAQRVALARALQAKVQVLCLDEPFNSLDRPLGLELLQLLLREVNEAGTAAILVTHQLEEAQAFAQRVGVLDRGIMLQMGDPRELVLKPATAQVAELVGYRGWLSSGDRKMALHPDLVRPLSGPDEGAQIAARVVGQLPQGARIELELEAVGRWAGRFRCLADRPAQIGDQMWFAAPGAPIFDTDGMPSGD